MENKVLNLEMLTAQYRKNGLAQKGYDLLSGLIERGDGKELHRILRNHRIKGNEIEGRELVNMRDSVDYLLEFYALVEVGRIANYLPDRLPGALKSEIRTILDNAYVKDYFIEYYPLALPQLLREQIETDATFYSDDAVTRLAVGFEKFLILSQSAKRDEDVLQFLWFLDDGITRGHSIRDLWNVLMNKDKIAYKLSSELNHPLNKALSGFVKYVEFLSNYAEFLQGMEKYKVFQSACWHFHSYWFEHMDDKLGDIIKVALKNIRFAAENTSKSTLMTEKSSYIDTESDYDDWRSSTESLRDIENQINYLNDAKMGEPLFEYIKMKVRVPG